MEQKLPVILNTATSSPPTAGAAPESKEFDPKEYDGKKHRAYFMVINNPTEQEEKDVIKFAEQCQCLVYQLEKGKCGTPHLQIAIYFKCARVWPKKFFPRAWIQWTDSFDRARNYSMKEDTRVRGPYEFGEPPKQGERTDLNKIGKMIVEGVPLSEIAKEFPGKYIQFCRGMEKLKIATIPDRKTKPRVIWLWGKSGVGKSLYPSGWYPDPKDRYIKDGTMWWDNYWGQKCVVIEDFDGKWPFRDLLRCLDFYAYQAQVKGGYVKIPAETIFITCEFPPEHFWGKDDVLFSNGKIDDENMLDQILRRIDQVVEVVGDKKKVKKAERVKITRRDDGVYQVL